MEVKEMAGQRFGRLKVLSRDGYIDREAAWACICDCGMLVVRSGCEMRAGRVKSCGCLKREGVNAGAKKRHGMTETPTYDAWANMRARCRSQSHPAFCNYGARGIAVCERWQSFENFLADMGTRPSPQHSIDRINNEGNYEPQNCRWATKQEQNNNRRGNVRISYEGKEMTVAEWARYIGVTHNLLKIRLARGWTISRALTQPAR